MRGTGAGKGSGARLGQYSPRAIAAYSRGYERIFGRECSACRGRGFYYDEDQNGKMIKHNCLLCNGTGRVKDEIRKSNTESVQEEKRS